MKILPYLLVFLMTFFSYHLFSQGKNQELHIKNGKLYIEKTKKINPKVKENLCQIYFSEGLQNQLNKRLERHILFYPRCSAMWGHLIHVEDGVDSLNPGQNVCLEKDTLFGEFRANGIVNILLGDLPKNIINIKARFIIIPAENTYRIIFSNFEYYSKGYTGTSFEQEQEAPLHKIYNLEKPKRRGRKILKRINKWVNGFIEEVDNCFFYFPYDH